jgi:RimJ/RimL family protein N-acetyltransferase
LAKCEIQKNNDNNKAALIDFLKQDIIKHAFAFYDIQYAQEQTTIYAAFENRKPQGYILIYIGSEFPSIVIECEKTIANELIKYAPKDKFIIHAPPDLLQIITRKFPRAKHYVEDWMLVKKGEASFQKSENVRKLQTEEDASKLFTLLETRTDRNAASIKRYFDWISKMPLYGVFLNDELVSYAGSFIQLPQLWMIGGVYTNPKHRNKGYATQATSAITEEALKNAKAAALFVRTDNNPAKKAYEKIGYRKIGEKIWIDVGTGLKP